MVAAWAAGGRRRHAGIGIVYWQTYSAGIGIVCWQAGIGIRILASVCWHLHSGIGNLASAFWHRILATAFSHQHFAHRHFCHRPVATIGTLYWHVVIGTALRLSAHKQSGRISKESAAGWGAAMQACWCACWAGSRGGTSSAPPARRGSRHHTWSDAPFSGGAR